MSPVRMHIIGIVVESPVIALPRGLRFSVDAIAVVERPARGGVPIA